MTGVVSEVLNAISGALESKFHPGEVNEVRVQFARPSSVESDTSVGVYISALDELFEWHPDIRAFPNPDQLRLQLEELLADFISETKPGWGQQR